MRKPDDSHEHLWRVARTVAELPAMGDVSRRSAMLRIDLSPLSLRTVVRLARFDRQGDPHHYYVFAGNIRLAAVLLFSAGTSSLSEGNAVLNTNPQDNHPDGIWNNTWFLSIAAVLMWILYLALVYQPGGAPFIYAEF